MKWYQSKKNHLKEDELSVGKGIVFAITLIFLHQQQSLEKLSKDDKFSCNEIPSSNDLDNINKNLSHFFLQQIKLLKVDKYLINVDYDVRKINHEQD